MVTCISLVNYTQKGIENVKDSPKRLKKIKKAIKAARGEVKAFFLTMGRYDAVYIIEAKNDETVAKIMLTIGAAGNVKTETLKAFNEEEFEKIIASIQ
jgi:uncharacterized protein with GYD domain